MKIKIQSLLIVAAALSGFASQPAVAAITRGARLATACTACHGPQGHSQGAIPSLAGQPAARLIEQMKAYRRGHDAGGQSMMNRVAPAYSDADIAALALYFAHKKSKMASVP